MLRLISAAVLAPILWVTIKLAPAWVFFALVLLVVTGGILELFRMMRPCGAKPFHWLGLAGAWAVVWAFIDVAPRFGPVAPLIGVTLVALAASMWRRENPREMLDATMGTLFPVVFVGLTMAYLIGLRRLPGEDGPDVVLFLFVCVIFADTAAYYVGSWLGKRRMAPRISPKKSWEGAVAGMLGSLGGALLAHIWFYQRLPLEHALLLGLLLGLAAIMGDLAESLVKRACNVKDSSSLIPGHGGLLDRTDSVLFAGPILYYYYLTFLQGIS